MSLQERPHHRAPTLFRQRAVAELRQNLYSADNLAGRFAPECVSQAAGVGAHALLKLVKVQMTRQVGNLHICHSGGIEAMRGGRQGP
jgi:hypothetical protein